ncbi:hypothetical protein MSAN_01915800 [Mycena sanguinolenta]|uniref:Arrestin-like N-terminal domain-containing protein n=1 Tax=Mycena sanguinolenta TaxID=230812 RepID=A0A8H6XN60_9AGAR|nr:hypothetical protein MSAN_01915800 [Mycena sanguinolenta]
MVPAKMSFLRNLLTHNHLSPDGETLLPAASKRAAKLHADSTNSSRGASLRDSLANFHSTVIGDKFIAKRRRPDHPKLGVPEWYNENPPPAPRIPGTAAASLPAFTAGNATALHVPKGEKPWLELVLYSHAHAESKTALYHNGAKISGEVRMVLDAPANIRSIDVWVVISSDSTADAFEPPIAALTVNVWNRKNGDPRSATSSEPFKGKFPAGTFVFPFELPALPEETLVKHPIETHAKNMTRIPLPPTYFVSQTLSFWGNIKYIASVNATREGFSAIDNEFDMPFQYVPLCKPLPRVKTSFPYLPTREEWPLHREVLVDVEGILGIQDPAVYTTGQMLEFSLVLYSANPGTLEALGLPSCIEVEFCQADVVAANALDPVAASREARYTKKLATGRAWRGRRPTDDVAVPVYDRMAFLDSYEGDSLHESSESHLGEGKLLSSMHSHKDLDAHYPPLSGHFVRLDGEVRVPACSTPSFRFSNMGREYYLNLLIHHPDYVHISPSGGLVVECPVWYVIDRFAHLPAGTERDFDLMAPAVPVSGSIIPVGSDAVRASVSVGRYTEERRPTSKFVRMSSLS